MTDRFPNRNNNLPGMTDRFPGDRRGGSVQDRRNDLQARLDRGDRFDNRDNRRDDITDRRDGRRDDLTDRRADRRDDVGDRRDDITDRRGDRRDDYADYRNDRRDDWNDNWNDRRDDWNDNWNHDHWHYDDWHHGHWNTNWNNNYYNYWGNVWDNYPAAAAVGLTAWGVNSLANTFGYWGYSNPYYVEPYTYGSTVIDYSQPLTVYESPTTIVQAAPVDPGVPVDPAAPVTSEAPVQTAADSLPPGVSQVAMTNFDEARESFYQGNFEQALESANKALETMPKDAVIHEFRALVLFALGRYKEAAAADYAVLSAGPGWDWTTLATMYPNVEIYTEQLRKLEQFVNEHPDEADGRFLLAYHYITMGHTDAAKAQLEKLVQLTPNDRLAKQLYAMVGGETPDQVAAAPAQPPAAAGPAVDASSLVGKWQATSNGAEFAMTLGEDGTFSWKFTRDGKSQEVKGVYVVDGSTLAMEPDTGGTMLADVRTGEMNSMAFKMIGAPPSDPGLKFSKAS